MNANTQGAEISNFEPNKKKTLKTRSNNFNCSWSGTN